MRFRSDSGDFPERRLADVPLAAPEKMREIQRIAQEDFGVDILQMTENAGRSTATLALEMLGGKGRGQRVVVLAGGGNKGAAGLVAARHLVNWGAVVEPIFGEVESEMAFVARRQVQVLRNAGIVEPVDQATSEITLEEHLANADLVIDALIGYGAEGELAGMTGAITQMANAAKRTLLALDLPSGLNAMTGEPGYATIKAATTLALDLPKRGVVAPAAKPFTGDLYLADLGIPKAVHERMGLAVGSLFSEGPIVRLRR